MTPDALRLIDTARAARRPMLRAIHVRDRLGITIEAAYRILRAHGLQIGNRYYITEDKLAAVLAGERKID